MKKKKCSFCLVEFNPTCGTQEFCSDACRVESRLIIRICELCKREFKVDHRSPQKFCAKLCSNRANLRIAALERRIHTDVCITCETCQEQFTVKYNHRDRRFCSKSCANNLPSRKALFVQRVIDGDIRQTIESIRRGAEKRRGSNNSSTRTDVRKKISETLRQRLRKIKPKKIPYYTRNHKDTRCRWYHFVTKHDEIQVCQGGYELAFAQWCDANDISIISHPPMIIYYDGERRHRYYPDFYLRDFNTYVDIKSSYTIKMHPEKLDRVKESNPHIKLMVIAEPQLDEVGIKVDYKSILELRKKYSINNAVDKFTTTDTQ